LPFRRKTPHEPKNTIAVFNQHTFVQKAYLSSVGYKITEIYVALFFIFLFGVYCC